MMEWAHAADWLGKNKQLIRGLQPKDMPLDTERPSKAKAFHTNESSTELNKLTFSTTIKLLRGARKERSKTAKTHVDEWNIETDQLDHV